ncbi:radical SAM protein [Methyloversatilis sp. XJ19-49]|uniref:B12-binding domain-containing radical SAM protein n=1 Tax=Methyloversatilis sp. XJ19-49 TaxID=2963429 RepID=UPI00211BCB60|nr:radical SAM protein [Methyloversatilis sp. XJ19-49]MCQ9380078.1 radical SAM protein [Methyloversatilis sp. XJ19-49]MCQ9380110.1 radical SAM protein [Methyloversatilis sp. XJ19-49]
MTATHSPDFVRPRVLSVIPPMTQLNTPYPSTAYLTGFLRAQGFDAVQEDLALSLVLDLLAADGLRAVRDAVAVLPDRNCSPSLTSFFVQFDRYAATMDATLGFLQGRDPTLAHRIASRGFLPEGPRFESLDIYIDEDGGDPLGWAFGALGVQDRARHFATLYLNDVADAIRLAVDDRFEFVRYAESLAQSQPTFDPLAQALAAPPTLIDRALQRLALAAIERHSPRIVLLSVPFPGAVYAAFRIAQTIKAHDATIVTVLGGGYVNTELRELAESRVFDFFDYVTLDAGERPLLALLDHLVGRRSAQRLVRTFVRNDTGAVQYVNFVEPDIAFDDVGTPTWDGLPLDRYLSLLDMLNPMHRLWSDGRWNKLTVAHGCYWKKCSFCDVSLDYISRYDAASATTLVDRVQAIVAETGQSGFHLVDEAAPPKSLRAFAAELKRRDVSISWWGNIRFEKSFTPELCLELADSGCIAISGGLEVASDRLLKLMKKGVSVDQVARVTKGFADAGILVHAYLMYGFPTQTVQDTVDALEYVRQLFAAGCIQSGFFHRFVCTVHSPVGLSPEEYGVTLLPLPPVTFAKNDVGFVDPVGTDHDAMGRALNKALYNYMHGIGLDEDVRSWFADRVPKPRVPRQYIERALG